MANITSESLSSRGRRISEATAFVAVWMAMGFLLRLDANSYLLLGIPITIIFQLMLRKAPLRALWVRSAPSLHATRMKRVALVVASIFALANAYLLLASLPREDWTGALYQVVAVVGSIPLAYSMQNFRRDMVRSLLTCFGTAGAAGAGWQLIAYLLDAYRFHNHAPVSLGTFALLAVVSIAQYIPVLFLIEEVSFRWAFDSHIYHVAENNASLTALYVSLLWGAWHFPITFVPSDGLVGGLALFGELLVYQGTVGFFLSIYWRRSGNLLVPGSVHAFVDSIRNGLSA